MTYLGGKGRIAKHILPIILKDRQEAQYYIEPFVGGANTIDKVEGLRIGGDAHLPTILALEQIRDNLEEIPKDNKEFTEDNYKKCREDSKLLTRHDISFVGFAYSFGAKWYGGWCRAKDPLKDYVAIAYRSAVKQSPKLQGITLVHSTYDKLDIPSNSIIYCDPPYRYTTKYKSDIDHDHFYSWCRNKKKEGHTIFISEYNMPDDFICVWGKEVTSNLDSTNNTLNKVEKLFTLKG
ncbi:MAG: DNA adenine methylase [Candidatus Woesearchaeota archaeon]|jgi:DNA adenine methylase|nr:DNA adenine methylase [Candidatus Woesearchaeota archaeon]